MNKSTVIEVGSGIVVLVDGDEYRVQHDCDRGERGRFTTAPALRVGKYGPGHTIVCADPLTVEPSIQCPDCGLHGFITDGVWKSC